MGRPRLNDGKTTRSMPIRMSEETRQHLIRFAEVSKWTQARTSGWLVEEALRERNNEEESRRYWLTRQRAGSLVKKAIESGALVRPTRCQQCAREVSYRIHAHHHMGYEEEHALDVQWLCARCHTKAHPGGDAPARYTRDGKIIWTIHAMLDQVVIDSLETESCARGVSVSALVGEILDEWYARKLLDEVEHVDEEEKK